MQREHNKPQYRVVYENSKVPVRAATLKEVVAGAKEIIQELHAEPVAVITPEGKTIPWKKVASKKKEVCNA